MEGRTSSSARLDKVQQCDTDCGVRKGLLVALLIIFAAPLLRSSDCVVPADAPVREFWALTFYDQETAALFPNSTRPTVGSLDKELRQNADGSVDIYIRPNAPAGRQQSNWIYTPPGKSWFPWFRVYGPTQALFDKTWKLPDIEKIP